MHRYLVNYFRIIIGSLFFIGSSPVAIGQNLKSSNYIIGVAWQQGSIIRHTAKIQHFAKTYPTGLELNIQKAASGKESWHALYRYPRVGLSFLYFDYHNLVIGRSFALSTYLNLPVKEFENSRLNFRFGTGLAYFTNKFDRQENPTNNIISTNYNAVIQTRLEYEKSISNKVKLLAGLGLNHYSNGGIAKPNLGVNIATGSVGLNFYSNPSFTPAEADITENTPPNYISLSSSIGFKQRSDFDTIRYVVNSIAISGYRKLTNKSTLFAGLEGFYDPSLFPRRNWDPRVKPGTKPDIRRVALNIGHELAFGNISFGTHVGYYIYRPYKADAAIYQRLETKVKLGKYIFVAAGLKLHDVIKADIIEYRLGLKI